MDFGGNLMRFFFLLSCVAVWSACEPCQGATLCGEVCVDVQNDTANCGACGTRCAAGQICSEGACVLECFGGTDLCGDSCADLQIDPSNCGACGNACPAGQVCQAGSCGLSCVGGTTDCAGSCVNTASDTNHCGACDNMCLGPQSCVDSQCTLVCEDNLTVCGGVCVNTQIDLKHCGACDNTCAGDGVCVDGQCGLVCVGGTTECDNTCVNTAVDTNHCGACNQACAWNELCVEGDCTTPQFRTLQAVDQGWHGSFLEGQLEHNPANTVLATGHINLRVNGGQAIGFVAGFMVFDLAEQLESIVEASIRVNGRLSGETEDDNETLALYDVSTAIETLRAAGSPAEVIDDLRSGTELGTVTVAPGNDNAILAIELNEAGLTMINAADGQVALGLYMTTAAETENIYYEVRGTAELVIGGYP